MNGFTTADFGDVVAATNDEHLMQWMIFGLLAVGAVAALANEFAFRGALFPSELALSLGFLAIAIAAAATILARYRNRTGAAARDLAIWAVIVAAILLAYWLSR